MGNFASKTPEPVYKVLLTRPAYEVRSYAPYVVAEVKMAQDREKDHSFRTLASYIGVFRTPENTGHATNKPQAIAMTAPVVFQNAPVSIPMTAPVVSTGQTMQFILTENFKTAAEAPVPTNPDVHLKDVPAKVVAVIRYPGYSNTDVLSQKLQELRELCVKDGLFDSAEDAGKAAFESCGYDPPFKPVGRRNEVWLHLSKTEDEVLQKAQTTTS